LGGCAKARRKAAVFLMSEGYPAGGPGFVNAEREMGMTGKIDHKKSRRSIELPALPKDCERGAGVNACSAAACRTGTGRL
jgi:hypothetical protein